MTHTTPSFNEKQAQDAARFGYMLALGLVGFVLLGTAWLTYAAITNTEQHPAEVPVSVYEAESFYVVSCSSCHGLQGQGGGLLNAPPLNETGKAWQYTDAEIIDFIRNGKGSMPAMRTEVRTTQLQAVVDYIKLWWTEEQLSQQPTDEQ